MSFYNPVDVRQVNVKDSDSRELRKELVCGKNGAVETNLLRGSLPSVPGYRADMEVGGLS